MRGLGCGLLHVGIRSGRCSALNEAVIGWSGKPWGELLPQGLFLGLLFGGCGWGRVLRIASWTALVWISAWITGTWSGVGFELPGRNGLTGRRCLD